MDYDQHNAFSCPAHSITHTQALPPTDVIRCPMEDCKRPLLAASDVLHILTPETYDQYTRGQLKVRRGKANDD